MLSRGDRVDVVLDCVPGERDGQPVQLVYVRLVTEPGEARLPPVPEGGARNVWQALLGVENPATGFAAFVLDRPGSDGGQEEAAARA